LRPQVGEDDEQIRLIFEYIKQLEQEKEQLAEQQNRRRIGFGRSDDDV
jgi:hypothetical protein